MLIDMTHRPTDSTNGDRPTNGRREVDDTSRPTAPSTDEQSTTKPAAVDDHEPWALRIGLSGALWILSTVASLMTSVGQVGFARWAGLSGAVVFGVPVILDMFDVVLLLLGYRQGRRKRSPYPLWALAAAVAAFGFYTNVVHAGHRAGLVFGAASAVTFTAWLVKLRIDLTKYLERIGAIPPGRAKFGKLALVAPRVALHAWTVSIRRRVTNGDRAVECAETWIVVHDDTFTALLEAGTKRRQAHQLARRTAWRQVFAMTGGPKISMPKSATVERVAVDVRPTDSRVDDRPTADGSTTSTVDSPSTDRVDTAAVDDRGPSTDRKSTRNRPTRRPTTGRGPTPKSTDDRAFKPSDFTNAQLLRDIYRPRRVPDLADVRGDTGWSYDRAKYAIKADRVENGPLDDSESQLAGVS